MLLYINHPVFFNNRKYENVNQCIKWKTDRPRFGFHSDDLSFGIDLRNLALLACGTPFNLECGSSASGEISNGMTQMRGKGSKGHFRAIVI